MRMTAVAAMHRTPEESQVMAAVTILFFLTIYPFIILYPLRIQKHIQYVLGLSKCASHGTGIYNVAEGTTYQNHAYAQCIGRT